MSRRCDLCGRGAKKVIRRSHSKRATIARQNLNLQARKVDGKKMKICTNCLKTLSTKGKTLNQARKK